MWIGSLCAVNVALGDAKWPMWYIAKVIDGIDDNGGIEIRKVQVVGETVYRDHFIEALSICNDDRQKAARALIGLQWGKVHGYMSKDDIRAAISKHLTPA